MQNQMTSIVKVKYVLLEIYEYSLLVFAKVNEETWKRSVPKQSVPMSIDVTLSLDLVLL